MHPHRIPRNLAPALLACLLPVLPALAAQPAAQAAGQQTSAGQVPAPPQAIAFSVGSGDRALPGTLLLPGGDGPFPALVLMHGSGPQDRDQTLGPNKPFRDIAQGLAERGIAVLRYDKRTNARPQDFTPSSTIDDETTDDAVAAMAALRTTAGIDPERVFVLGHSQGAMLAPRIATRAGAAGAIAFAAPSRPLLDILVEQLTRNANADGNLSEAERKAIATIKHSIARLRAGEALAANETPLGLSRVYWRSVEAVDPLAEARRFPGPLLVLHGGRDIQVTDDDFHGWQQAFADAPRVTLRRYPALSHLGIAGTGPGSLADYRTPGHVETTLLDDIADWIHAQGKQP